MKVKWNPISSSDQVFFAQGLTGSVPENLCLISRGELTSVCVREAVLVHLSGQVIVSVAFVNEVLPTRVLRNTVNCDPHCPAGASTHSKLSLNSLKPSHLFLMPLSDSMIWFLLYCSSIKTLLCTKNMRIKLCLASSKKNFSPSSNNLAVVPISHLYHADF